MKRRLLAICASALMLTSLAPATIAASPTVRHQTLTQADGIPGPSGPNRPDGSYSATSASPLSVTTALEVSIFENDSFGLDNHYYSGTTSVPNLTLSSVGLSGPCSPRSSVNWSDCISRIGGDNLPSSQCIIFYRDSGFGGSWLAIAGPLTSATYWGLGNGPWNDIFTSWHLTNKVSGNCVG